WSGLHNFPRDPKDSVAGKSRRSAATGERKLHRQLRGESGTKDGGRWAVEGLVLREGTRLHRTGGEWRNRSTMVAGAIGARDRGPRISLRRARPVPRPGVRSSHLPAHCPALL